MHVYTQHSPAWCTTQGMGFCTKPALWVLMAPLLLPPSSPDGWLPSLSSSVSCAHGPMGLSAPCSRPRLGTTLPPLPVPLRRLAGLNRPRGRRGLPAEGRSGVALVPRVNSASCKVAKATRQLHSQYAYDCASIPPTLCPAELLQGHKLMQPGMTPCSTPKACTSSTCQHNLEPMTGI